jgi:hypothetical protein
MTLQCLARLEDRLQDVSVIPKLGLYIGEFQAKFKKKNSVFLSKAQAKMFDIEKDVEESLMRASLKLLFTELGSLNYYLFQNVTIIF